MVEQVEAEAVDLVDLERGKSISPTTTEIPASTSSATVPDEERIEEVTGQTGCSRRKQFTREWMFFPACERQISMVLDYLAAELWDIYKQIEDLELQDRNEKGLHHRMHKSDSKFGEKKEALMEKMTAKLERYVDIFSKGSAMMNQTPPTARTIDDFRAWAYGNIAPDPSDFFLCPENYRNLGRRPSVIDNMMHAAFQTVAVGYNRRFGKTNETKMVNLDYATLSIIAHVFIISFALVFLFLPLTLVYFLELGKRCAVLVVAAFCLCFCFIFFVFAQLGTDQKFLIVFGYMAVMATLLSNL